MIIHKNYIDNVLAYIGVVIGVGIYLVPLLYVLNKGNDIYDVFGDKAFLLSLLISLLYSFVTTLFQLIGGFCVAYICTINVVGHYNNVRVYFQIFIDCIVLVLYFIPSIGWKWIADDMFSNGGWFDKVIFILFEKESVFRSNDILHMFELWYISIIHLFPFAYLVYRYVFIDVDKYSVLYSLKNGYGRLYYYVRYKGVELLVVTFLLFLFRFFVMFGKYDLPFMFNGLSNIYNMTFSLWIKQKLNSGFVYYDEIINVFALMIIVFLLICFVVISIWVLIRIRSNNIYNIISDRYKYMVDKVLTVFSFMIKKNNNIERSIVIIGMLYLILSFVPIIVGLFKNLDFNEAYLIIHDENLLRALRQTYIYMIVVLGVSCFFSYAMFVSFKIKEGLLLLLMFLLMFYFYAMPSGVLFTIGYGIMNSLNVKIGGVYAIMIYVFVNVMVIVPMMYLLMVASTVNISKNEVMYLVNSKIGFYRSYASLLGKEAHVTIT